MYMSNLNFAKNICAALYIHEITHAALTAQNSLWPDIKKVRVFEVEISIKK